MNSWPSHHDTKVIQKDQGKLSKIRSVFSKNVSINIATLVWVAIVIFPAVLGFSGMASEVSVTMNYSISGGLSNIIYNYWWIQGSGYYPVIVTDFTFFIPSVASPQLLLMWSLNLWLGVTTLQYVLGKSTKKRVRILAIVIILIDAIQALLMSVSGLMFGMGFLSIPLPFYPITMLLVAKFVHAPVPKDPQSEEMIRVPIRTRISSIFSRRKSSEESTPISEPDLVEDSEISDT